MDNEKVYKYIILRIVCIIIVYILGAFIAPYIPNTKIVRGLVCVIMLVVVAVSFYIIGHYQKKAMNK